jgi:hypothetical protein
MSLLTAIAAATIFALFGFPYRYYQCWFSFSRLGTTLGTLLYLVLAGGGGGLLGWGIAVISNAHPTLSEPFNGALYGIGGALALRADFRARPKSRTPTGDQFKDARSALMTSINWTAEQLDDITYRRAEAWLTALPDDQLIAEAWRIQAHIADRPTRLVNDKAKNEMFEKLVPAMEKVNRPAERSAGRAHLITFSSSYYRNEHFPRLPQPPSISSPAHSAAP